MVRILSRQLGDLERGQTFVCSSALLQLSSPTMVVPMIPSSLFQTSLHKFGDSYISLTLKQLA